MSPDATTLEALVRALAADGLSVAPALEWSAGEWWLWHLPVSVMVVDLDELGPGELLQLRRLHQDFPHVKIIALVSLFTPEARVATTLGVALSVFEKPVALPRLEESVKLALMPRPAA